MIIYRYYSIVTNLLQSAKSTEKFYRNRRKQKNTVSDTVFANESEKIKTQFMLDLEQYKDEVRSIRQGTCEQVHPIVT
jgi:hypothetical protein